MHWFIAGIVCQFSVVHEINVHRAHLVALMYVYMYVCNIY